MFFSISRSASFCLSRLRLRWADSRFTENLEIRWNLFIILINYVVIILLISLFIFTFSGLFDFQNFLFWPWFDRNFRFWSWLWRHFNGVSFSSVLFSGWFHIFLTRNSHDSRLIDSKVYFLALFCVFDSQQTLTFILSIIFWPKIFKVFEVHKFFEG